MVHCFGGELPKVFKLAINLSQTVNIIIGNVVRLMDIASVLVLVDDLRYLAYSADPVSYTHLTLPTIYSV